MKIAQFKTSTGGTDYCSQSIGELMERGHQWVRMSEYVEVVFTPLPPEAIVEGQLKQLDAAEQELRNRFQEKLNELADARAKLLSLTHEKQS